MKKELRDAWVAALRSGEYEQTTETLESDGAYCCLGVLCVVAKIDIPPDANDLDYNDEGDEQGIYDLRALRDDCGLGTGHDSPQIKLITMNDEDGKTFPEIADWIEMNVPVES